jgi:hypothetical protein
MNWDVSMHLMRCIFRMILFLAGWVHRDISSGNHLRFEDAGSARCIIANLVCEAHCT